jgi:hypothetical protein
VGCYKGGLVASLPSGARAVLTVALLCFALGSCGVVRAWGELEGARAEVSVGPGRRPERAEVLQASEAFARTLAAARTGDAHRRFFLWANLVVSGLLLVAWVNLLRRRPTAVWWVTQAAVANLAWTVGDAASAVMAYTSRASSLDRTFLAYARALEDAGRLEPGSVAQLEGVRSAAALSTAAVLAAALSSALYAWLVWRVRRPDVAEALGGRDADE